MTVTVGIIIFDILSLVTHISERVSKIIAPLMDNGFSTYCVVDVVSMSILSHSTG